jgi:hypothetical protein
MNHGSLASESFRLLSAFVYHILSDREVVDGVTTVKYDIKLPNLHSTIHFRCHPFYNYNPFIFCGISVAAFDPQYIAISDDF